MVEVRTVSIVNAVERILETMCFAVVVGPAEPEDTQTSLAHCARLEFRGRCTGTIEVGLTHRGAHVLASGFLGEENVDEIQLAEFSDELANMICGAVVSDFAPGSQFALSPPIRINPSEFGLGGGLRADFALEEGYLSVVANQS